VPQAQPAVAVATPEAAFATKALPKFLKCLTSRAAPVLLDLGPVVGTNVTYFGELLGCKMYVEDVLADLERHAHQNQLGALPAFFRQRFSQADASIDGILCWDLIQYLDRPAAEELARQLTRMLRADGVLLGFFGTAQGRQAQYTKYVVVDEASLMYRPYAAARSRPSVLQNRDIIRLFPGLRVSDSFLLQNNVREILFKKAP
jgi:hypothetical protein